MTRSQVINSLIAMLGRGLTASEFDMIDSLFAPDSPESRPVNPDPQKRVIWAHHASNTIH